MTYLLLMWLPIALPILVLIGLAILAAIWA